MEFVPGPLKGWAVGKAAGLPKRSLNSTHRYHARTGTQHLKGTLLGIPNREPQEHSRNIRGIYLPGSLYSSIFLPYSWGSLFGVPSKVPLALRLPACTRRSCNNKQTLGTSSRLRCDFPPTPRCHKCNSLEPDSIY